ncbi:hypothetical protein NIES37_01740 [Tolypothrix tenuis PCC 7101]|uniref:Cytochrome c domain-containing protein n=1 Tax=Tolypothrix tenuis PCC 7101 TaxID=231146 RepID=A0A1Z4MRX8_9CYAN|nr:hypothetical protein [Aulosira sp. FACHB-113]BAY96245.1 hypothetical protein NIES37_01740 [Tolypothrix tenuis PCC 7101]BAZ73248.1 hypothetical protein NIES50_18100 [Aulosira laxa NIES-50]
MFKLRKLYLRSRFVLLGIVLAIALFIYKLQAPALSTDIELGEKLGQELIAACPVVNDPQNLAAFNSCADKLAQLTILRDTMNVPFLWGAQSQAGNYNLKNNQTTQFDPLVWRRTYLSTFMFRGEPLVEQVNNLIVIHVPTQFRNQLDIGDFPYPFWHSSKKWSSYQKTTELLFFLQDKQLKGALRSAVVDPERPTVDHAWDGKWIWTDTNGKQQPHVTLYTRLFSTSNPYVVKVDAAYRAFEAKLREHSCLTCHSPDNSSKQNPLLILNYPNQALTLRHETVRQIQEKRMPPPNGITDERERQNLIELAQTFAKAGDQALAYEGEKITVGKNYRHPI